MLFSMPSVCFFPESLYYRLTNHICQMEESSHSFSTMGILRLLRWLCSAAPQPLCLFVLYSLPHISFTAASLLTVKLSNIQRHFDAGIVTYIANYILAWKILQWSQSLFPASCCLHSWSSNDTWDPTVTVYILYILQYICVFFPPAELRSPYAPSALIIDFYISSLFPYATSLIEITDLFVEPLTPAGDPASPINPMFSSLHWEKTHTDRHTQSSINYKGMRLNILMEV